MTNFVDFNQVESKMEKSVISQFFNGRSVFVTGSTGLMGKVLVWKLLYSCPGIKNIFVLIRSKRGKSALLRYQEIINAPLFDSIRKTNKSLLSKLQVVCGDVGLDGLGITQEMKERLISEVSIVFHGAATLNLDASLTEAINLNTSGTLRMLELCSEMKNLEAFVHFSTAFCHVDLDTLDEEVHKSTFDAYNIMRLPSWLNENSIKMVTPHLISPHPNTYTFSKRLAEDVVGDFYPQLPVVIARPSIVTPALKEPLPGWVDNLNGPTGILAAGGKGVLRSILCNSEYTAEAVPVDFAINAVIVIAWKTAISKQKTNVVPVYNLTQHNLNPITWDTVMSKGREETMKNPFELMLWYPTGSLTSNRFIHTYKVICYHWIPAYLIDGILFLLGQKRFMIRVQQKISDGLRVLQYFTLRNWDFTNDRLLALRDSLSEVDRKTFSIDFEKMDMDIYFRNCILGARQYCLKEDPASIPKARKTLKVLYVLDLVVIYLKYALVAWLLYKVYKTFSAVV
ncbi:putative fatty acyl-CoA reductase CG5065 [Acyrthosiphon pisum]|uniref:Fatty acyl-CoA reductase n=1 Tax=Acyrthosiphon pisum TaxID=7029 RepID=A0A8R2F8V6_ACYPI|nr:putative fatty acyl-CoA reductase CG5065 [Acyrthosiphon pisum]|eukprot:XP_008183261.1 PREDICTED: putative fatty acyl-CoA reductase CG5065 [Acyrthosiphon pisum]